MALAKFLTLLILLPVAALAEGEVIENGGSTGDGGGGTSVCLKADHTAAENCDELLDLEMKKSRRDIRKLPVVAQKIEPALKRLEKYAPELAAEFRATFTSKRWYFTRAAIPTPNRTTMQYQGKKEIWIDQSWFDSLDDDGKAKAILTELGHAERLKSLEVIRSRKVREEPATTNHDRFARNDNDPIQEPDVEKLAAMLAAPQGRDLRAELKNLRFGTYLTAQELNKLEAEKKSIYQTFAAACAQPDDKNPEKSARSRALFKSLKNARNLNGEDAYSHYLRIAYNEIKQGEDFGSTSYRPMEEPFAWPADENKEPYLRHGKACDRNFWNQPMNCEDNIERTCRYVNLVMAIRYGSGKAVQPKKAEAKPEKPQKVKKSTESSAACTGKSFAGECRTWPRGEKSLVDISALPAYVNRVEPILARIEKDLPEFAADMRTGIRAKKWYFTDAELPELGAKNNGTDLKTKQRAVQFQDSAQVLMNRPWFDAQDEETQAAILLHELAQHIRLKTMQAVKDIRLTRPNADAADHFRFGRNNKIGMDELRALTELLLSDFTDPADLQREIKALGFGNFLTKDQLAQLGKDRRNALNAVARACALPSENESQKKARSRALYEAMMPWGELFQKWNTPVKVERPMAERIYENYLSNLYRDISAGEKANSLGSVNYSLAPPLIPGQNPDDFGRGKVCSKAQRAAMPWVCVDGIERTCGFVERERAREKNGDEADLGTSARSAK